MPPRKKLTPRKMPRQERAQATVEAILQAATYILIEAGWEGLTTNRVADRAGVNIASLYQYFPNKEAIVGELQRRHVAKARAGFPEALPVLKTQADLRAALRLLMEASVREHQEAPVLHRIFAEELPRSTRQHAPDHPMARQWSELVRPFVKNVPDLELAGYVARVATHAVIHEAAADRPELLREARFVDELVTLLERYLVRPARAAKVARAAAIAGMTKTGTTKTTAIAGTTKAGATKSGAIAGTTEATVGMTVRPSRARLTAAPEIAAAATATTTSITGIAATATTNELAATIGLSAAATGKRATAAAATRKTKNRAEVAGAKAAGARQRTKTIETQRKAKMRGAKQ